MAGKRNKQRRWKKLRQSVISRFRKELEYLDVHIMSNVMVVVLLICVIAATVAWFTNGRNASLKGMQFTSADAADIEVSLSDTNWQDVYTSVGKNDDTSTTAKVTIEMPAFTNIYDASGNPVTTANSRILAPGVYGTLTFYVKSVNENCTSCKITIDKNFTLSADVTGTTDEETDDKETSDEGTAMSVDTAAQATGSTLEAELESILQGHILCFGTRTGEAGQYQYSDYLSADTPLVVDLKYDEIQTVTIYWVWPYEYSNLLNDCFKTKADDETTEHLFCTPSDEIMKNVPNKQLSEFDEESSYVLKMREVYCWEKFDNELENYLEADSTKREEYLEDWYDYADTMIGNYVTNLSYKITIKGVMSDG